MDFRSTLEYLNCAFVNSQSVGNKTIQITEMLNEQSLDVLAISETWLSEHDSSSRIIEITPATHTFLHSPTERQKGKWSGNTLV